MAELDRETARESRRATTASKLQQQAAQQDAETMMETRRMQSAAAMANPLLAALQMLTSIQTQAESMKTDIQATRAQKEEEVKAAQAEQDVAEAAQVQAAKTVQEVATEYGLKVIGGKVTLKPNIDTTRYKGKGTAADPFTLDGIPFTGFYGGKEYVNGVDQNIKISQTPAGTAVVSRGSAPVVSNSQSTGPTTNVDVLKALLRGMGFNNSIIDISTDFLNRLLKDGIDYDNAATIFLNTKDYTFKDGSRLTSPFYTEYGYINEGLTVPYGASELFNAVEGYKGVVDKYQLNSKYISKDNIKKYAKNRVTVADLDERANAARLRAVNSDASYVNALVSLGYIKDSTGLTDFYMNPDIGKEALEQNRGAAAFTAEAIRRAQSGIAFNKGRFEQISAGLVGKGLSETQISSMAAEGFENIAQQLQPTQMLSDIYRAEFAGTVATPEQVQQELESEQFLGITSDRRKKVSERNIRAFQGQAGTTGTSFRTGAAGAI
jgi:hypothetical protein